MKWDDELYNIMHIDVFCGYRALLRICMALLWSYRALLRIYMALLWIYMALLRRYVALLWIYRALSISCTARMRVERKDTSADLCGIFADL